MLIKGGHEEGDALADALIEDRQYDQLAGPADRHHQHPRHRLHAWRARSLFSSPRAATLADAVARAREFVRVALLDAPDLGQGAGPIGQARVRLDVGAGPRLNQVTVTGTNYERSVDFYSPPRPQADRRQSGDRLRALRDRRRRRPSRSRSTPTKRSSPPPPIYLECDDLDDRVEQLARSGIAVRARPAQPALDVARGAPARPRRQHHFLLQGRRERAASRRGGSTSNPHDFVIPAKAGIQPDDENLGSRFRGNDE